MTQRIVIICGAGYVSGKEIMSLELGRGLAQAGTRPYFVTSRWNNGDFISRLDKENLKFEKLPIGFISATVNRECVRMTAEQVMRWPSLAWGYAAMLRDKRPTKVIHTNWHHLLLLYPWLRPERDIFWLHESLPSTRRYHRVFQRLAGRLGTIVCVSHAVATALLTLGVPHEKVLVIHNGLDAPISTPRASGSEERLRIGIIGQIGAWKGHRDLVDAVIDCSSDCPGLTLEIFGEGEPSFVAALKELVAKAGIVDRVTWHGFESRRERIYEQVDVCVVPSRSMDPLPTTAIEASFHGIPVIATRRGGLPEIVSDGLTGLLVDHESPSAISRALRRLFTDPGYRRALGVAARRRAELNFGKQRFIEEFLSVVDVKNQSS